jgi:hypothetical protein
MPGPGETSSMSSLQKTVELSEAETANLILEQAQTLGGKRTVLHAMNVDNQTTQPAGGLDCCNERRFQLLWHQVGHYTLIMNLSACARGHARLHVCVNQLSSSRNIE